MSNTYIHTCSGCAARDSGKGGGGGDMLPQVSLENSYHKIDFKLN